MCATKKNIITEYLELYREEIRSRWISDQLNQHSQKLGRRKAEFEKECDSFYDTMLNDLKDASGFKELLEHQSKDLHHFITDFAKHRVVQGFSPGDTARYVLGWRLAFFTVVGERHKPEEMEPYQDQMLAFNSFAEDLSLMVIESFVEERDEIINAQQAEIMELSTPVIKVWEGVLTLPIVGTLDSMRSQQLMENVLQEIVKTGSTNVIIDISGVPMVDTLTAQHLIKTAAAIRLMGAKCIISGIRPEIATTMVGLGISLDEYSSTKSNMADALQAALQNLGLTVTKAKA